MYKKISLAAMIAILAALASVALVSAENQPGQKHAQENRPGRYGLVGKILEVTSNQIEVESPNGETHIIELSEGTIYRNQQGNEGEAASSSDLQVGMWVAIYQKQDDSGKFSARLVVLLPDDFDPSKLSGVRVLGNIEKINPGQNTFELITRNGELLTFHSNEATRFMGGVNHFEDLEKGMVVAVLAVKQADGSLLARLVAARPDNHPLPQKTSGKISQIAESSITISLRQGGEQTFTVTEETRFGSRQGDIHSIEDLQVDMLVVVLHRAEDVHASAILVADQALLNVERVRGTVQSAGGTHLTINAGDEKIQFIVDDHTRIRGRGIEELNDIKNGMNVLVFYVEQDGSLLAKGILVFPSRTPTP